MQQAQGHLEAAAECIYNTAPTSTEAVQAMLREASGRLERMLAAEQEYEFAANTADIHATDAALAKLTRGKSVEKKAYSPTEILNPKNFVHHKEMGGQPSLHPDQLLHPHNVDTSQYGSHLKYTAFHNPKPGANTVSAEVKDVEPWPDRASVEPVVLPAEAKKREALASFLSSTERSGRAEASESVTHCQAMEEAKKKEEERKAREEERLGRKRGVAKPPPVAQEEEECGASGSTLGGSTFGSTRLQAQSLNPHQDQKEAKQHAIAREAGMEVALEEEAEEEEESAAGLDLSDEEKSMKMEMAQQVRLDALLVLAQKEAEWGKEKGSLEEILGTKLFEVARQP